MVSLENDVPDSEQRFILSRELKQFVAGRDWTKFTPLSAADGIQMQLKTAPKPPTGLTKKEASTVNAALRGWFHWQWDHPPRMYCVFEFGSFFEIH